MSNYVTEALGQALLDLMREKSIEKITADFESVRYAMHEPDDAEAAAILSSICAVIKRYLF